MNKVKVGIVNFGKNDIPKYMTEGSAGLDIKANLDTDIIIKPLERFLVPTGIKLEIPEGYEVQVRPRSGLAYKHGITVLNTPGTIDSDYRGEVKVILVNLSNDDFLITSGERIAQLILSKVYQASFEEKENLSETNRGSGGFGHTGKK